MIDHVAAHVFARAAEHPDAVAVRSRVTDGWVELTYADLAAQVRHVCHALIAAGLHPGDSAVIVSDNRAEWLVAELAIMAASGVALHLGPSTPVEELAAILRATETRAAFVSGEVLGDQLAQLSERLPSLRVVVCFDENPSVVPLLDDLGVLTMGTAVDELGAEVGTQGTFSWARLMAAPFDIATAAEAQRRCDTWSPEDIAVIDYTVGGAGELRGVVLSHRSTLATVKAIAAAFEVVDPLHEVATLPLHHSLQHGSTLLALLSGGSTTLVPRLEDVPQVLRTTRPTMLMTTMPVLRSLVLGALEDLARSVTFGRGWVAWAREVATVEGQRVGAGRSRSTVEHLRVPLARALVARRVRRALGGPKDLFVVGGTGAPPDLMHLLELAGIPAHRGWTTLEAGVLATVNVPQATRAGSVGRPLPCVELRLDDEGEVLLRGPGLMRGYFGMPLETQRVLEDGWLHTGQIGRVDAEGYLHLTSRLDDMIVTESLHYVAPHLVESRLRGHPVVADVVVVGDGRPCIAAIIEPDLAVARSIRSAGGLPDDPDDAVILGDPLVVRAVGDAVRTANASLAHDHQVRAFRLTPTSLRTLGQRTASSVVRRQRLEREFADIVDAIYASVATDPSHP
ncbi:AMP-dependent synthetase/ligase [Arsenicicoccus dermatophilus]|uniref:AMP-dependent synthetase/ligase n=1 Tax=Arsenicicoccus dermatophilus TaxID=1076331 RepID=UPI001F4C7C66|nr:AMP-binding protein [Arsenicicoccus dermatophilus]MCH8613266.1 AMP-binding protein [Arsenicicoccus dermatophilus]